jgi:8-oxo-dGTP diphosphatase
MILQVGVKVLLRNDEGKYLFLRRAASFKAGPQKWDIPGGRIESDEALEDALRREVKEETAMDLTRIDSLLGAHDIFVPEKDLHVVRLTYAGSATGEIELSDEHDIYKWMAKTELEAEPHVDVYLQQVVADNDL